MASTTTTNTKPTTYVYGSGKDLSNAQSIFTPNSGYKLVDVSAPDFDTSTMQSGGIMLGGNAVNKNITDSMLNNLGISRIAGLNANDTMEKAQQYKVNSLMPSDSSFDMEMPQNTTFQFNGSMQQYLDQAQNLLKPQYDLQTKQLNSNYDNNIIPGLNNDTLKRGLARSSYAGNRVDQANEARQDDLSNLSMQQQMAVNNMASQNYNTAYDRAYREYGDQFNRDMTLYNTAYGQYNDQFNRGMNLYNAANQDLWQNKNFNNENAWNQKNYDLSLNQLNTSKDQWQKQYDSSNSQWQKTFDFNKTNADREYQLQLQQMAQAAAKAASGGSRSSGGSKSSGGNSKSSSGGLTKTQIKDRYSQTFDEAIGSGDYEKVKAMVYGDKQNIINDMGYSYWQGLEKKYANWQSY